MATILIWQVSCFQEFSFIPKRSMMRNFATFAMAFIVVLCKLKIHLGVPIRPDKMNCGELWLYEGKTTSSRQGSYVNYKADVAVMWIQIFCLFLYFINPMILFYFRKSTRLMIYTSARYLLFVFKGFQE